MSSLDKNFYAAMRAVQKLQKQVNRYKASFSVGEHVTVVSGKSKGLSGNVTHVGRDKVSVALEHPVHAMMGPALFDPKCLKHNSLVPFTKLRGRTKELASRYIAEEMRTKKYPRAQAIAIGISRARREMGEE